VVVREGRLAVVHRPRYDDWSLPKGKLDPGETWEGCALREVEEETGLRCALGEPLRAIHYTDRRSRPKEVRYWRMAVEEDTGFTPGDETDELRWLTPEEAEGLLSYDHDRALVREASSPG